MSLNPFKNINHSSIFLLLFIAIFFGINLNTVSAATINVDPGLQNYDIQTLINEAHSGDTINFTGNSYNNISLIINKKLNIISLIKTVINGNNSTGVNGSNMGLTETFAFYFAGNSSGSVISGFNILTNSDYGIIAENTKNVTINSNNISGGYKGSIKLNNVSNIAVNQNNLSNSGGNGLDIENSKKVSVAGNQMSNNKYSGIRISNSNDTNVKKNNVSNNTLSGVSVYSSKNVSVKGNIIKKNGYGVYLSNTNKVNVSYNEINENQLNGIDLEDTTKNTYISYNKVTGNLNGLFIDSYSINDTVCHNYFTESRISTSSGWNAFETGIGIEVGDNYRESSSLINIEYNGIFDNKRFNIKSTPSLPHNFEVGKNWYNTNNPNDTGVCPMVGMCGMLTSGQDIGQVGPLYFVDNKNNYNNVTGGKTNSGNGSSIGNGTGYLGGNGNGSYLGSGSGSANGNGSGSGSGLFGNLKSNGLNGGSSGGKNGIEVSIKNTLNSMKNNPYTILGVLALIVLVAVGYFKRDKFN